MPGEDSVWFMTLSFNEGKTWKTFENVPILQCTILTREYCYGYYFTIINLTDQRQWTLPSDKWALEMIKKKS